MQRRWSIAIDDPLPPIRILLKVRQRRVGPEGADPPQSILAPLPRLHLPGVKDHQTKDRSVFGITREPLADSPLQLLVGFLVGGVHY